VVTPQGIIAATVVIENDVIKSLLRPEDKVDCSVEDFGNLVLMPGLVDTHVHINEPGRTDWEGFATATQAAAAGGITTLVDMPLNSIPVTINREAFAAKLAAVSNKLWVDCGFWGGVVPDSIDDLGPLIEAGVLGVKSFLIDSGIKEFPKVGEADLRRILPVLSRYDVPYLIHAELNNAQTSAPEIGSSYQRFLASRPKQWENDAVKLMIRLANEAMSKGYHCKVHIVHLSSANAIAYIDEARMKGLAITAETCPHYLTLSSEDIVDGNTLFKCCPPIREENNRQRLWQALENGSINFIVSDHSPCTPQLKLIDQRDLELAWGGISSLQFSLPLIWTEAKARGYTLADVAKWMSTQPAKLIGLGNTKGRIACGWQADLFVFDDTKTFQIKQSINKHRHKQTPYDGKIVEGEVLRTYVRGKPVYANNQFCSEPIGQVLLNKNS
jgi:allantoinase